MLARMRKLIIIALLLGGASPALAGRNGEYGARIGCDGGSLVAPGGVQPGGAYGCDG
jgi:hypothetical protein